MRALLTHQLSVVRLCEERRISLTPKRRRIAEVIDGFDGPFDAESVWASLRPGLREAARDAVFKAVRFFADIAVIARHSASERGRLYYSRLAPERISLSAASGARVHLDDPDLKARIVAFAARSGLPVAGRELIITVGEPTVRDTADEDSLRAPYQ